MTTPNPCPFCTLPLDRVIDSNQQGQVIRDAFPISPGHTLVIPKRHVGSFFDLATDERLDLLALLDSAKAVIDREFKPQAYNIGINDGAAAGQTVPHLHIHLIPRHAGDCQDPRGGVRWIFPGKADYWSSK
jgi:diadenosine tetraphosphate (Ap4A) HIT family hydrolase